MFEALKEIQEITFAEAPVMEASPFLGHVVASLEICRSIFSILKKEELYRRHYASEADLMKGIRRFIDFYNSERPHSTIQYKTPEQKEKGILG